MAQGKQQQENLKEIRALGSEIIVSRKDNQQQLQNGVNLFYKINIC